MTIASNIERSLRPERWGPILMSLRDDLARVLATDPRYSIHAYAFVFEALEYSKTLKRAGKPRGGSRTPELSRRRHVTGRDLCEAARRLALSHYGMMALTVLKTWGLRSTSDLGEIVYNLIAAGELTKSPTDSRSDFDNVFDFETALRREYVLTLDDVA